MTNERNLKTSEIPPLSVMVERNLAKYAICTSDLGFYEYGYTWYDRESANAQFALETCYSMGLPESVDLYKFCKVISIVSPGRKWRFNIKDAKATCLAWLKQDEAERVAVLSEYRVARRFGLPAFRRAWGLLDGTYELLYSKAPKTFSFAHNLAFPDTSPEITFDQHNAHIVLGEDDVEGSIGISPVQYEPLKTSIQVSADEVGIEARRFQGLIWTERVEGVTAAAPELEAE